MANTDAMDTCALAVVYTERTISSYGPVAVQPQFLENREVLEQKKDTPTKMLLQQYASHAESIAV